MAKKQYYCILDTETTMGDTVADFAMVICDRHGTIYNQCAVLVQNHYGTLELFHDKNANDIWGYAGLEKRKQVYRDMLVSGLRMLASVSAINRWIGLAVGKYNPMLTAYNLAFDKNTCKNTQIDLSLFNSEFCLWQASVGNLCNKKSYRQFALENHAFNSPTQFKNMTFSTNAETVCGYIRGEFIAEPHTALEDARDFELPILTRIVKTRNWRDNIKPYNWRDFQVKNNFQAL